MRVIQGTAALRRQSAIEAAYDHFRLDRQGNLVSANTLQHYRYLVGPFFDWLREAHPDVEGFEDLDVSMILDAHRLLVTFLRWAANEEYPVDQRILKLKAPKVPLKERPSTHRPGASDRGRLRPEAAAGGNGRPHPGRQRCPRLGTLRTRT
jgi:hypothetical protein